MATSDSLQVAAKYTEINVRIYAPQVLTAATTLALFPTSKIAKENFEGKCDSSLTIITDPLCRCRSGRKHNRYGPPFSEFCRR